MDPGRVPVDWRSPRMRRRRRLWSLLSGRPPFGDAQWHAAGRELVLQLPTEVTPWNLLGSPWLHWPVARPPPTRRQFVTPGRVPETGFIVSPRGRTAPRSSWDREASLESWRFPRRGWLGRTRVSNADDELAVAADPADGLWNAHAESPPGDERHRRPVRGSLPRTIRILHHQHSVRRPGWDRLSDEQPGGPGRVPGQSGGLLPDVSVTAGHGTARRRAGCVVSVTS